MVQDKEVRKIGGDKPIAVDVRIISATNRNLQQMVDAETFRLDLFYRLNVVEMHVPPLRERREDIPLMAIHFLNAFNREYNASKALSPEVLNAFRRYAWPGNVRELRHVIESLVVTANEAVIQVGSLPPEFFEAHQAKKTNIRFDRKGTGLKKAVADLEIYLIQEAIKEHGTAIAAVKYLGIDGSTLAKKRQKYGI